MNRTNPIKAFFTVPWGKDQVRSNIVLIMSFTLMLTVWGVIVASLPDDADMLTTVVAVGVLIIALFAASFLLKTATTIRLHRNISISCAMKIQFHETAAWFLRLPFNIACTCSRIDDDAQMYLIDGKSPDLEKNHPFISRFIPLSKKGNAQMLKTRELLRGAPPVGVSAIVYSPSRAIQLRPFISCFENMESFLAARDRSKRGKLDVAITTSLSSVEANADNASVIYKVLHALGFVSQQNPIVVLSSAKIPKEELAAFLEQEDIKLVYDDTSTSEQLGLTPQIGRDMLEPIGPGLICKYRWHGALPDAIVVDAVRHELASVSSRATIIEIPRKIGGYSTSVHPVQILNWISLGMSDVDTSIENFSVCRSNEDYSVFKNGTLEYDPVFGAPLEKVHAFTGELDDVLAIWDKAQADFGIHVTFPYTEDTTEEEIRKSIEGVADLMGVPPMLEAYYAGVPVEDVIA